MSTTRTRTRTDISHETLLTDRDRQRIFEEEMLKVEIARKMRPWWWWANESIVLWLLSSVVVTFATWWYTTSNEKFQRQKNAVYETEQLRSELQHRIRCVNLRISVLEEALQHYRVAVRDKGERPAVCSNLYNASYESVVPSTYLFPAFREHGITSLLTQLDRIQGESADGTATNRGDLREAAKKWIEITNDIERAWAGVDEDEPPSDDQYFAMTDPLLERLRETVEVTHKLATATWTPES